MTEYKPGKCNIGKTEKRNRAILGASGLLTAALMAGLIVQQDLPNSIMLFTFIPFLLGFEGIFQALNSFCVHYAHKGVYNEGEGLKEVTDEESREKDKDKAKRIHGASVISAAICTVVVTAVVII
ncbi:MAG: hypothetical protein R6V35_05610 [Candidatus Nanohaloarchaea archaeon]